MDKEQARKRLDEILAGVQIPSMRRNTRIHANILWLMRNLGLSEGLSDESRDEAKRLLRILVK